jgi:exopolyphosphatase/pppGpp-phosphohydrolase
MERATIPGRRFNSQSSPFSDATHIHLETWVRRRLGSSDHERRVAQIAGAMFDLTQEMHDLSRRARWTLIAAAVVHDVGKGIDRDDHARAGADALLSDPTLPLSSTVRRWLAYLTLYHRGRVHEPEKHEILRDGDDPAGLLKVLALLRASDTLDSRSIEPPRLLLISRDRQLQIRCFLREYDERAHKTFCRRKKYRLLEETLDCTVDVQIQTGDAQMLTV